MMTDQMRQGARVAIMFGPEDRGLKNEETEICSHLLTIPTNPDASSLNLAQAVLIVLYECFKSAQTAPIPSSIGDHESRLCTHGEQEVMIRTMRDTLLDMDYLREDNPDYFMLPVRRFLQKMELRRHEFSMIMGICRQVRWLADKAGVRKKSEE